MNYELITLIEIIGIVVVAVVYRLLTNKHYENEEHWLVSLKENDPEGYDAYMNFMLKR